MKKNAVMPSQEGLAKYDQVTEQMAVTVARKDSDPKLARELSGRVLDSGLRLSESFVKKADQKVALKRRNAAA